MPRKKQDRPKRSESEIPLDLTVKKSDDDIDPIKLSEPRSSSISPGIVSLSIFVSPNPKGNKTPTQANAPTTTTISRVSGSVNNFKSGNSKSTSKTSNNVIHSSSSVKHSTNNGNDSRSTKEGTLSGPASGSGGGANRQNPWQTQWINRSSEQNRDVFTCVWCKDSFRCLAEMTQHMKASPRCGMAGMQQATNTVAPGLTSTTSNSLLSSSSSSSSSSNSLTTNTTTTSTTGTYPLIVPSIAGLAASSTASRSTTPTSIGTGTSTNKGKSNVDLRESLSTPSTPSSMKSSSSISPSLHHPNQVHHHSSSSPNQGPTNSNSDSNNSNLPNQNSTKEPMSSSVLAKNSVNLPRKLVRGQDVWLGRGAEQTRQILKFDHKDECYDDEQGKAQEKEEEEEEE